MNVADERATLMSEAGEKALDMFRAHGLDHAEALMVIARIAGIFEAGVERADERIDIDMVHEEFEQRVVEERKGFSKMLAERLPKAGSH